MKAKHKNKGLPLAMVLVSCVAVSTALPAVIDANPSNYRSRLSALQPGDILNLAPGDYSNNLPVNSLNGRADAWIVIQGPASNPPAIFLADVNNNTVEITHSSYVAIRNLTLNGQGLDGPFGVSAGTAGEPPTHHILVEGCTITNYNGSQQTVGISTKTPTWGWIIRRNRIINAGTGLYLGNSDGSYPFVAGIIENNLVRDCLGYDMQIKLQNARPVVTGMPTNQNRTLIRHNVFIKNDAASPDGDRPNLLVGGFPDSGAGSSDLYEIYGNFFCHNPRESLLQAAGRVTIHDNIFVDVAGTAIRLAAQDQRLLKLAHVYNNTIYSAGTGISVGQIPDQEHAIFGNLIFAITPISGAATNVQDNLSYAKSNAGLYVTNPSTNLAAMDFYPRPGQCQGSAMNLAGVSGETDYSRDFNGASKGGFTYRGAYAGEGTNPGWALQAAPRPPLATPAPAIQRFTQADSTNYSFGWPYTVEWTQVEFTRSLITGMWQSLSGPLLFATSAVVTPPADAANGFFRLRLE